MRFIPNKRSDTIAKGLKLGHTASSAVSLAKSISAAVVMIIIAIIFTVLGLPWYIGLLLVVFAVGIVVLNILHLKRVSSIRLK